MHQKTYIVYLHSIGFSQRKLKRIFHDADNHKQVFDAVSHNTLKQMGFSDTQCEKILEKKSKIQTDYIDKKLLEYGVNIVVYGSPEYPKNLSQIDNAPYVLYVRGELQNEHCLAVVGSRKISTYGKKVISKILTDMSPYLTIVSGGAYGCDSEAHRIALSLGKPTIAVVGTGIDISYPASNASLYNDIISQAGAIISIFPLGESGNPHNFPIRNEIISGMSLGTLVIEAAERSGTLITANLALEQGRDVFAVPGEIDKKNSAGCHALIKNSAAKMVTQANDIHEEYSFLRHEEQKRQNNFVDPLHREIHNFLSYESLSGDILSEKLGKSVSEILPHISLLELKKILRKNQEGKYELC